MGSRLLFPFVVHLQSMIQSKAITKRNQYKSKTDECFLSNGKKDIFLIYKRDFKTNETNIL